MSAEPTTHPLGRPGRPVADSGRRLVVFVEKADGPTPWHRNFYRYGMETPFAFRSPSGMTCAPHRGGTGKQLFPLNHFVTNAGGSRLDAGRVNARDWVLERTRACEAERGSPVSFITVDCTTVGDALGAVNDSVRWTSRTPVVRNGIDGTSPTGRGPRPTCPPSETPEEP